MYRVSKRNGRKHVTDSHYLVVLIGGPSGKPISFLLGYYSAYSRGGYSGHSVLREVRVFAEDTKRVRFLVDLVVGLEQCDPLTERGVLMENCQSSY